MATEIELIKNYYSSESKSVIITFSYDETTESIFNKIKDLTIEMQARFAVDLHEPKRSEIIDLISNWQPKEKEFIHNSKTRYEDLSKIIGEFNETQIHQNRDKLLHIHPSILFTKDFKKALEFALNTAIMDYETLKLRFKKYKPSFLDGPDPFYEEMAETKLYKKYIKGLLDYYFSPKEKSNQNVGDIKAPILALLCKIINDSKISVRNAELENVEVYCQRICKEYGYVYTDRVRQNFANKIKAANLKKFNLLIFPHLGPDLQTRIKEYLGSNPI